MHIVFNRTVCGYINTIHSKNWLQIEDMMECKRQMVHYEEAASSVIYTAFIPRHYMNLAKFSKQSVQKTLPIGY